MTEILVGSIDDENGTAIVQPIVPSSIQMQGFVASSSHRSESGSYVLPEGRDRVNSMPTTSLRSEPDLDTIMPLPGTSYRHGRSQTAYTSLAGGGHGGGGGSDTDSDEGGGGGGDYGAGNASFTAVEVCEFYL